MAKVFTPNPKFTGKRAGVAFADGVGETDEESLLRFFKRIGYRVEAAEPKDDGEPAEGTVAALRAYAQEHDIDLGGATKKADILAAIDEAEKKAETQDPAADPAGA